MIDRHTRLIRGLAGLALLAAFPVAYLLRSWLLEDRLPLCLYRLLSGKLCAFCGLTRSLACATHGDWAAAWSYNPLWWLAALVILLLGGTALRDALTGSDGMGTVGRLWWRWGWYAVALAAVATALRWFV